MTWMDRHCSSRDGGTATKGDHGRQPMVVIAAQHLSPLAALIAGSVILIMPRLLNYVVAVYLIFIGLVGFVGH